MLIQRKGGLQTGGGRMTGALVLANTVELQGEDSGAVAQSLARVDASDRALFGDSNLVTWLLSDGNLIERTGGQSFQIDSARSILRAVKTADEDKTTDTTLADDDDMIVAVEANASYLVRVALITQCQTITPDFKATFSKPTGATLEGGHYSLDQTNELGSAQSNYNGTTVNFANPGTDQFLIFEMILEVGGTAGNFALQWAQVNSDADFTRLRKGSTMELQKVA